MIALVLSVLLSTVATGEAIASEEATTGTSNPEFVSSSLTDHRGDVVPIAVQMNDASSAKIDILGRKSDYDAHVTVRDGNGDGRVTLRFNTYLAGGAGTFETAESADSVSIHGQGTVDGMVPADNYRLRTDDGNDLADLRIRPRETKSLTSMVAPKGSFSSLVTSRDVSAQREAGNLTGRTGAGTVAVAEEDVLVLRFRATGFSGLLAAQPGDDATERFQSLVDGDALTFEVEQTNPASGRVPATLMLNRDGVRLVTNVNRDAYFLVVDTERAHYRRDDDGEIRSGLPLGARFEANLTVEGPSGLTSDGPEHVGVPVRVVERSATLRTHEESGRSFVDPARGQTITGRTTLAPGSTLTVEVTADDGDFQRSRTVRVQPGDDLGTFETGVNLQALEENTTIEISAHEGATDLTSDPVTATVRSVSATVELSDLETAPGSVFVTATTDFSRGGLLVVRAYNESGRVLGTEPVEPGPTNARVELQDLPPKDSELVVAAVRDIDGDGHLTPDLDVRYTEVNSPRPLDRTILLYTLPPSPTPTPSPSTDPPDTPPTDTPGTAVTATNATTPPEAPSTAAATPDDAPVWEEVPGFGVGVTVPAMLVVALLVRRRG